jgi:hypothetical protein
MKKWVWRAVIVALLLVGAFFAWQWLFPSPERVIRKRLAEVAQVASFTSREGPLAQLANSQKLTTYFSSDVVVTVDVPGRSPQTFSGRDTLLQGAMGARSVVGSLSVEFLDMNVALGADKLSAVVNLTAKGKTPTDLLVQELKVMLQKIDGVWLIIRVETVKTLSGLSPHRQLIIESAMATWKA